MNDNTAADDEMPEEKHTAEWHLEQAEEHLAIADDFAARNFTDAAVTRLFAAAANAQIGALKLALQMDAMVAELARDARIIRDTAEALETRTRS